MIRITTSKQSNDLLRRVEELSGQNLFACYQCGTCSAGCPFISAMDTPPEKVIRQVTFGLRDVLQSNTIWLCASCYLCAERCPRNIDVAKVMEALRHVRLRQEGDQVNVSHLSEEVLRELPPIALVANVRKNTG